MQRNKVEREVGEERRGGERSEDAEEENDEWKMGKKRDEKDGGGCVVGNFPSWAYGNFNFNNVRVDTFVYTMT